MKDFMVGNWDYSTLTAYTIKPTLYSGIASHTDPRSALYKPDYYFRYGSEVASNLQLLRD